MYSKPQRTRKPVLVSKPVNMRKPRM